MKRVATILGALESSRRRLIAEVEGLAEPRFSARPARGGWSVAQVFEHLVRMETRVTAGVEAGLAGRLRIEPRASDFFRRLLWQSQLYRVIPLRTSPPNDPALDESPAPARPEALARLDAARAKLMAAIEGGEGRGLWKLTLSHPIFGPMSMEEILDFVASHEERHRLQIVRIKAALDREGK